jgi:hypothetical protein
MSRGRGAPGKIDVENGGCGSENSGTGEMYEIESRAEATLLFCAEAVSLVNLDEDFQGSIKDSKRRWFEKDATR